MSISAPENAADVAVAAAAERQRRTGVLTGMASYALWGLFPLYFHALSPTTPVEILAHRVVWSFLGMMGLLTLRREWGWIAELRRDRARLGRIWLAGVLLAINWLVYVWAVTADRVIDASLGYFVNPLVTVAMGGGWSVLVAGKGHENEQIVGNQRLPFSDRNELERAIVEQRGAEARG